MSGISNARNRLEQRFPCLSVLWHSDPDRVGARAILSDLATGHAMALSRSEPAFAHPEGGSALPLADPHLSRRPIRLVPADGPGEDKGAIRLLDVGPDVICRPPGRSNPGGLELDGEAVSAGVVIELAERVVLLLHRVRTSRTKGRDFGLVGASDAMVDLRQDIERVADLDVPVLLRGETGTGKELVARAIHAASSRRPGCLSLNIGAIPPDLAAAELFGASRGAFTGADRRRAGYFARADGGTLFLDEIGECPADVQVLLLRALESGEIQPVGADRPVKVDVRVIAATDADLEAAVASGSFRAPLLHRLDGYGLRLPPLRHRRDDIGRLLLHFLRRELEVIGELNALAPKAPREPLWLPAPVVTRMAAAHWPGNVRQLRNLARQIVIARRGAPRITLDARLRRLLEEAETVFERQADIGSSGASRPPGPRYRQPSEVSEQELLEALQQTDWQLKAAAAALGVSRTSLYSLVERHPDLRTAARLQPDELAAVLERHDRKLEAAAAELKVSVPALRQRAADLGLLHVAPRRQRD